MTFLNTIVAHYAEANLNCWIKHKLNLAVNEVLALQVTSLCFHVFIEISLITDFQIWIM